MTDVLTIIVPSNSKIAARESQGCFSLGRSKAYGVSVGRTCVYYRQVFGSPADVTLFLVAVEESKEWPGHC